jgi:hypothetical protein
MPVHELMARGAACLPAERECRAPAGLSIEPSEAAEV